MRLIHTSDWHIGKRFLDVDMLPLQAAFADWFVDVVRQESIDCVLISGDLYDRANPKDDAVDLLDDMLHRISAAGASMILISGNHDSAERLHFGTRFMSGSGLHIRTERRDIGDVGGVVSITGRDGLEVDVMPLPYLDPERVALEAASTKSHEAVLQAVVERRRAALRDPSRTIAMAHAFVTGGAPSDSERNLTIGGSGLVSADLFKGFGYVALGHLHRPQVVGDERLVYSGTPMPYSFSEEHAKSIRVVTVDKQGIESDTIECEAARPVVTIEGPLDELTSSSRYAGHKDSFVRARLTDTNFQIGAMERLRARFPHVLEMEQTSIASQGFIDAGRLQELARRSEEDVVRAYVEETWPDGLGKLEMELLDDALLEVLKGERP